MAHLLSRMEEVLDARDQLLTEKADLLAQREVMMDEEIRQLKAQLAEEKEKTIAAELIAEQALQAGTKATRNWEKEKKRRKIAEEILRGLQGILHDSVTAGLLPQYQAEQAFTPEISQMDKQTVKSHCRKYGIETDGKSITQLKRELQKLVEPVQEAAEPVQEAAEPVQEPAVEAVQEPAVEAAEPVQEPAAEPVPAVVPVDILGALLGTPTARDVLVLYENFLTDVELPHFWNMKLLREHANQLGLENTGQDKVTLRDSVRQAVRDMVPVAEPLVMLGHIEERLKQKTSGDLNKGVLLVHCRYYTLPTYGKSKSELKKLLLERLA